MCVCLQLEKARADDPVAPLQQKLREARAEIAAAEGRIEQTKYVQTDKDAAADTAAASDALNHSPARPH
jgi:hypothetical protein